MRAVNAHARSGCYRDHSTPTARAPVLPSSRGVVQGKDEREASHHNRVEINERDGDDGMKVIENRGTAWGSRARGILFHETARFFRFGLRL